MTDQTPCEHNRIVTFRGALHGTDGVMWACHDCRRRFYPACPTCVDVGHRNVEHPETATDVDRLRAIEAAARAVVEWGRESNGGVTVPAGFVHVLATAIGLFR